MGHDQGCGGWGCHWGGDQLANMMREHERIKSWNDGCAWGAPSDNDRFGCMYNEVVLRGGDSWNHRLPELIEAVFYPKNGHVDHWEGDRGHAWQMHSNFLRHYHQGRSDTPLLSFDVRKAQHGQAPFALA